MPRIASGAWGRDYGLSAQTERPYVAARIGCIAIQDEPLDALHLIQAAALRMAHPLLEGLAEAADSGTRAVRTPCPG